MTPPHETNEDWQREGARVSGSFIRSIIAHPPIIGYRRWVLTLLLLTLVVDYADRTLIGAMGPTLKRVFDLNNAELGMVAAAVNIVGALAALPVGMLTDRVKRTRLLAVSLTVWTGAMVLVGASVSFAMLFLLRLLLGAVTAVSGPTTPSLVGDLAPAGERGKALGLVDSGQTVGIGVGFVVAAIATGLLSFRWGFWLLACAGGLLSVAFWCVREPQRTGASGPGANLGSGTPGTPSSELSPVQQMVERQHVPPARGAIVTRDPRHMSMWDAFVYVLRVRTNVVLLIARSIGDYFLAAVSIFGVVFATGQYGISPQMADLSILVLGIGALAGVLLIGRIADYLLRHGHPASRVWVPAVCYVAGAIILLPAFLTHQILIAAPAIAFASFFLAGSAPPLDAARVDVQVPRLRGRAEAIREVLRTAAEGGAPVLFGILAEVLAGGHTAGLRLAFLITLPALFLNGIILLIGMRTYEPDVAAALASTGDAPTTE